MRPSPTPTTPPSTLIYTDPRLTLLSASVYYELQMLVSELLGTTVGLLVGETDTDEDLFATVSGRFIGRIYRIRHQHESKG